MKGLGDSYVKSEFKLFKSVTNEGQLDQFYTGWNQYLDQILRTARKKQAASAGSIDSASSAGVGSATIDTSFGRHLPPDIELSEEQKIQLEKLKDETSKVGLPSP
jgi:hypothetical protein